jgi:hypothetical protein
VCVERDMALVDVQTRNTYVRTFHGKWKHSTSEEREEMRGETRIDKREREIGAI